MRNLNDYRMLHEIWLLRIVIEICPVSNILAQLTH
jgi:adenosine deaminase